MLTPDVVRRIAALAALDVPEATLPAVHQKLTHILGLVDQINSFDTRGIDPMAHPLVTLDSPCRADVVTEGNDQVALLANAPDTQAGLFLVPQVIE